MRPRKKRRLAAPASRARNVKRLPLREELEVLREALPPVIRSHLDPPRDDKGPIPNERRTFGEFLRWKSLYDDEMVSRITDERHVVCKRCRDSFALCHDTAYNWYKWGRHREWCIDHTAPDSDRAEAMKPPSSPVLLHNELLRRTGRPEVDALFPKTKGGPYYQHSWTYFVPRPGQSRPDDLPEAPAPSSSILSSEIRLAASPTHVRKRSRTVESVTLPSRPRVPTQESGRFSSPLTYHRCPWCLDHNFKAEEEAQWSGGNILLNGVELLLAAAKFVESTHVQCTQNMHSVHFPPI
uniref:Peroxisomal targeting signal 2 receptor n=1 Tax=Ganoderma boninense TaxID=34458 RepID=A0A5K1JT17_9APHY|nr:Peroxisomal targeting signal 2 receptor [Ganoderma boninense]